MTSLCLLLVAASADEGCEGVDIRRNPSSHLYNAKELRVTDQFQGSPTKRHTMCILIDVLHMRVDVIVILYLRSTPQDDCYFSHSAQHNRWAQGYIYCTDDALLCSKLNHTWHTPVRTLGQTTQDSDEQTLQS